MHSLAAYNQSQGQENGSGSDIIELLSLEGKHPQDVGKENTPIPVCNRVHQNTRVS
jgi:hypothetical protein